MFHWFYGRTAVPQPLCGISENKAMSRDEETHERAADAIEEAVASRTVAIIGGTGERELREVGTGTAISYRGSNFILTARHVVEDTPIESLRFFCRPEGSLQRVKRAQLRQSARNSRRGHAHDRTHSNIGKDAL